MYTLRIDTTQFDTALLELKNEDKVIASQSFEAKRMLSEKLIPELQAFLQSNTVRLEDISSIDVNEGPGSFTATRIGVAVANALAFALDIPINDKEGTYVTPVYAAPAHITMSDKLKSELESMQ